MYKELKIKYLIGFMFCLTALASSAQVRLMSLDQLDKRLAAGKDTTYVVNFWATWCGPCVEELPYFEKLHVEKKKEKVKVLLVSLDFKSKLNTDVIPFVKKMKLKSEIALLNESKQQVYIERVSPQWSGAIPATLFINTAKNTRKFYEKEFTYKDLVSTLESLNK